MSTDSGAFPPTSLSGSEALLELLLANTATGESALTVLPLLREPFFHKENLDIGLSFNKSNSVCLVCGDKSANMELSSIKIEDIEDIVSRKILPDKHHSPEHKESLRERV